MFKSLTAYIVASKIWGSIVIVTGPSFVIESLGGLFGGASGAPFLFVGLVQNFSNMPSLSHFCRERCKDSARTPLGKPSQVSYDFVAGRVWSYFTSRESAETHSQTDSLVGENLKSVKVCQVQCAVVRVLVQ